MEYEFLTVNKEIVKINLTDKNDEIIINEPENIIAFQSDNHKNRIDYTIDEIKMKFYRSRSRIIGHSSIYVKSRYNATINILELTKDKPFIFNLNLLAFTKNINVKLTIPSIKKGIFNKNIIQHECMGNGIVMYYGEGNSIQISLINAETIFVNPKNIIGYEKDIDCNFRTYGNFTATRGMDYHYKFTGPGKIIIQTQSLSTDTQESHENFFKRAFKEFVPGGGMLK